MYVLYVCMNLVSAFGYGGRDGQLGGTSSGQHSRIEKHIPHDLCMYVCMNIEVVRDSVCILYVCLHGVLQIALNLVQHVLRSTCE